MSFPCFMPWPRRALRRTDPATLGADLQPLFEAIVNTIPAATGDTEGALQILVTNLDYSDYFGRIAICRVFQGTLHAGDDVNISKRDGALLQDAHHQAIHLLRPQANRDDGNHHGRHRGRGRR